MKNFLGEYQHSLDAKGRLILPADFRGPLADGAFIGIGKEQCLVVYTPEEWERVANEVAEDAKAGEDALRAARALFGGTREVKPDGQGRVPIAPDQREYAHLEREVVVAGFFRRIEIWSAELWERQKEAGRAALASSSSLPGFAV
jgi:MraZ protein